MDLEYMVLILPSNSTTLTGKKKKKTSREGAVNKAISLNYFHSSTISSYEISKGGFSLKVEPNKS